MSIVVTGGTGKLGGLVVQSLLRRGIAADQIIAAGRNRDRPRSHRGGWPWRSR